jgi:hypothetical protein
MSYKEKFSPTDEFIGAFDSIMNKINIGEETISKFTGALSVSAVTSFELAIKEILIEYASNKHPDFGNFVQQYLCRLNGRIKLRDLKEEIKKYKPALAEDFEKELINIEKSHIGIRSAYQNLIENRHTYVHGNHINLTYEECKTDYISSKLIIEALAKVMK